MRRFAIWLPIGLLACVLVAPEKPSLIDLPAPTLSVPPVVEARRLPTPAEFEALAKTDAVSMLRACLNRCGQDVKSCQLVMQKQERVGRRLGPVEVIDIWYRDQPHSVLMKWRTEPLGGADRALYVDGAHNNQMVVRPKNALARAVAGCQVLRDPDGRDAKLAGLVSIRDFGFRKATERTLTAWDAAQKVGRLNVEYRGIRQVPGAGDRTCHVLSRTCDPPEEDGLVTVEIAIDTQTWLQVGSVLSDSAGKLIAAYFFRDVDLNPGFDADQFDPVGVVE